MSSPATRCSTHDGRGSDGRAPERGGCRAPRAPVPAGPPATDHEPRERRLLRRQRRLLALTLVLALLGGALTGGLVATVVDRGDGASKESTGEVIGINSAKVGAEGAENMGFAVAVDEALPVLRELSGSA